MSKYGEYIVSLIENKGYPYKIHHGEYIGVLCGEQPLLDGDSAPLYRFPGGVCVEFDYKKLAVEGEYMEE